MKNEPPLVSVLICTYNAARFLRSTLASVTNQSYPNMEILVRDNNSSDGTVEIIEGMGGEKTGIRVFQGEENLGAYGGLNYLLRRAKGKYIAIQDHDDLWHKDKLEKQVAFLEGNTEYKGCGAATVNYYEKDNLFLLRRQRCKSFTAWHTSLIFRNEGSLYNASLKVGNDFFFMKHTLCRGEKRIYNLPEPYVLRRIRRDAGNLSSSWSGAAGVSEILKARLGIFDTVCLLNRLVMSDRAVTFLTTRVFFRSCVLSPEDMGRDGVLSSYLP